ncbi:YceI family protein [Desulfonema ishimotonii]|uniref:YceI family protein n=1 Tax=Desulfonema ishimotonii TaxID=45657 RepID=A0A401FTY3_9BACT|nr:YceI family protein [Desulfonema ishimotonii]GBC60429.1 YceI family protein [Desulfonema ishimotonii]
MTVSDTPKSCRPADILPANRIGQNFPALRQTGFSLHIRRLSISATLCLLLSGMMCFAGSAHGAPSAEQVIVFVQPGKSSADVRFRQHRLPEIKKIAASMNADVSVVELGESAPAEVAITPLIVYQNYRGRSVYQGRTTTLRRVQNFIRTSRFVPQGDTPLIRRDVPVWKLGRAQVWAPVKITLLTGNIPENYDHETFTAKARKAIAEGFENFQLIRQARLSRSDRGFYMDFYPWISEENTLYLSLALFSQFHCKNPVFEKKKKPLVAPWSQWEALFRQAGAIMEQAVRDAIEDPESGDGFDPVDEKTETVTWEQIGFPLPPEPEKKAASVLSDAAIPTEWVSENRQPSPDDPPVVQFRFPAPLDQYAGEVTRGKGELHLARITDLDSMRGFVEMEPGSVTMGEPDLDKTLQGSLFLNVKKYPAAKFTISSVVADSAALEYGRLSPVSVTGLFTLKGRSLPLTAEMEMEPVLSEKETPLLLVRGTFQIHLDDFNIEGADGPEPASKILVFDLNFTFRPKDRPW